MRVPVPALPLLVLGAILRAAPAGSSALPPLEGRVSGELLLAKLPGAPPLRWSVDLRANNEAGGASQISAEGEGTKLRGEVKVDLRGDGTWRLTSATLDLARWRGAFSRWGGTMMDGVVVTGTLSVTGHGTLQHGRPSGELLVVLRDGEIRSPSGGWRLTGVSLSGSFALDGDAAGFRSTAPLTLLVQTITTTRFGARNLGIYGRLENPSTFALSSARLEIAGGDMTVAPCRVELHPFQIETDVTVNRVGLQDVAALVPDALRSAHGRIDGVAHIGWTAASGFDVGAGHIVLRPDEPAQVTLRPFPGLFTGNLPTWMLTLPAWLVHWSLPGLRQAELGQIPINASSLQVTFSPTPDAEGRTAVIRLTGVPDYHIQTPIMLQTNVRGPLRTFIKLTHANNVSVGVH
ncbi:MAG TPA: hypothetical protein VHE61_09395 [Opitutaceae bacterium]|nr:hypothetical protein [Opitutaceae bacterium]